MRKRPKSQAMREDAERMWKEGFVDTARKMRAYADTLASWEKAREYVETVATADRLYPCKHGHVECATSQHGRCVDEAMRLLPEEG